MSKVKVIVKGMNCNHCKMIVETNIKKLKGIEDVLADIEKEEVVISGENIDLEQVRLTVEGIGYKYMGSLN